VKPRVTAEAQRSRAKGLQLVPVPPAGNRATGSAHEMEHQADNQQDYADDQQYVGEEKSEDGEDNSEGNHVSSFYIEGTWSIDFIELGCGKFAWQSFTFGLTPP
jgi:hypothetical protein